VVTVGTIHAGSKRNIIPDEAKIGLTVRSYNPEVQKKALASIERIAKAEAAAAGAPREPEVKVIEKETADVVVNDPELASRLMGALKRTLGDDNIETAEPHMTSEDFGVYGRASGAPSIQLRLGAVDPKTFAEAMASGRSMTLPGPSSPLFAPDRERTIKSGIGAIVFSARELMAK
jgi:hippurate hydrolase